MPPANPKPPKPVIGDPRDSQDRELNHLRTVSGNVEQYILSSPSIIQPINVRSEADLKAVTARVKAKKTKKAHKLGNERYEKIDYEPIRVD